MKKILPSLLILWLCAVVLSCKNDKKISADLVEKEPTSIKFKQPKHDFGKIEEGEVVTHSFEYKNTGKNPLVISMVTTPCGCTTPKYSKDPLAPGETDYIEVSFNSKDKYGLQDKELTVIANTSPPESSISFKVEVTDKKK